MTRFPTTLDDVQDFDDLEQLIRSAIHRLADQLAGDVPDVIDRTLDKTLALDDDESALIHRIGVALYTRLVTSCERGADAHASWALHHGATYADLGDAAGVTRQRAHQRFGIPEHYEGERFLPQPSRIREKA